MINPTYTLIAGVDEVGRAPLAGPVVAGVVIFDQEKIGKHRSKTNLKNTKDTTRFFIETNYLRTNPARFTA